MWIWTGVLTLMTVGGVATDLSDGEPRWYAAMGLTSGLACVVFVLNHGGIVGLGNLAPAAVLALAALLYEAWRDLGREYGVTQGVKSAVTIVVIVPFVAAVFLGVVGPPE